jgi:hypothetical protein
MIYNNPTAPAAPLNPDTGAAELISPGSIGAAVQTDNTPPSDYTGKTAKDWYDYLYQRGLGKPIFHPDIPGYSPPAEVLVGQYMSIETTLQQYVQFLVGPISTRNWSDVRVATFLMAIARDSEDWNGPTDPGAGKVPTLVAKYVKVYRVAVTPA